MRIVHLARGTRLARVWTDAFVTSLEARGELTLLDETASMPDTAAADIVREHDVAIVGWDSRMLPAALAEDPGQLRYVCCYSGTIRWFVPRELVAAGIPVSNWGDLPAPAVAEAALTHLLAALHQLPLAVDTGRAGGWGMDVSRNGMVDGLAVGVYGCGVIGRRFIDLLRPLGARVRVFDPYVDDLPSDVDRADSLEDLCTESEALVIHAGLSDETEGSVTADHLSRLPDGGVVVNTARGAIVDQDALFAELLSGRLRAGLDVLEPDSLADDHPIRQLPNVLFTFHQLDQTEWPDRPGLGPKQRLVIEQLRRFGAGEPLLHLFDLDRYDRST